MSLKGLLHRFLCLVLRLTLSWKAPAILLALATLALTQVPAAGAQSTYYLSPLGSDAAGQGTEASPWATLNKLNALDLRPGDRILLEGGATFAGTLYLGPEDGGTATAPVVIGSYGRGQATIHAGEGTGLLFHNGGGFSVSDLVIKGSGGTSPSDHGIVFYSDVGDGAKLEHVRVDGVRVEGFNGHGLAVISAAKASGYRDVRITNSDFYENGSGVSVYGPDGERAAVEDLYIGKCRFFGNGSRSGPGYTDGSGIAVSQVGGGTIERNVAWGNGMRSVRGTGAAGIAVRDASDVTVQHNEAYGNGAEPDVRSGGFFFEDVRGGTVQYNYSHDNAGGGFGFLASSSAAVPGSGGSVVRFNLSENDLGGALVIGEGTEVDAYHNTFFVDAAGASGAVVVDGSVKRVRVRNSLIAALGEAAPVIYAGGADASDVLFQGNGYWSDGPLGIRWGGRTFSGLDVWRSATGQETDGGVATGLQGDPLLVAPGRGGLAGDAERLSALSAYKLQPGSPFLAAGLDLRARFGTDLGATDFFGNPLSERSFYSIGAHQATGGRAGGGLTMPPPAKQEVALRKGWNLVARWVEPRDARFDVLFAKVLSKVQLVRSGTNTLYCTACPATKIGRWDVTSALRIYASEPARVTIAGTPVTPEAVPLALSTGWNDVPYLHSSPMPVEEAMASVATSLVMVKDFSGNVYYPARGIDTIGLLQPGQGYQVRLSQPAELVYPLAAPPTP